MTVLAPPCLDCKGGGDINGTSCMLCRGTGREAARSARIALGWKAFTHGWALRSAGAAGRLARWSATIPGLAGAAGFSYGMSAVVHGVFLQVPQLGVALVIAGVFLLLLDRRL